MFVKGKTIPKDTIHKVLLIQLGDIGDVVWATPTFRAVKETYPGAAVSVLLRGGFGSLLQADPSVQKIFEVEQYKGNPIKKITQQIQFVRTLRHERFNLVFDLRSDDRGAFMSFLSGAPIRATMIYPEILWRNLLFTHLVDPRSAEKRIYGAAEQSLRIVREFGIAPQDTVPKLHVSAETSGRVKRLLDREGVTTANRWITLNPFSRWRYKEWGYEKWVRIMDWLWEEHGISTVIVGASDEANRSITIVRQCKGRVYNLTGRTTLDELAGVLRLSSLHMGVDSAAPHIAGAVGTPTITIYGPSDWRDWAPVGEMHHVVTPDRDCSPCYQKGCDGKGVSACLEELSVDRVRQAIQESLSHGNRGTP